MSACVRMVSRYVNDNVEPDPRRLWLFARVAALALGAIRAWSSRNANNPGGISYLDIADAYMRGDFHNAVNGFWSPLYSLLLGLALQIIRPDAAHEAAVAHLVNFFIFGAAMVTFEILLRVVIARSAGGHGASIPRWAWIGFGYAAFAFSSLMLIGVADLSGDLLKAVFVYAAAAILVRLQIGRISLVTGGVLGLVLGLGYLAKAAMFPLSFVFFAAALPSRGEWRRNLPAVAAAMLMFVTVASPFVVALSSQKQRPTTGDVGKLAYAWFVNDVTKYAHWQGELPGRGVPLHPDRKIHDHPAVFEYATPISGTHPPWYDASYWYEGLETHFDGRRQVRALLAAARVYWELIVQVAPELLVIAVLLSWRSARDMPRRIGQHALVLAPALFPFAMFAVVHTETRFVGAFLVIAMLGLLLAVRLPPGVESRRVVAALMIAATVVISLRVTVATAADLLTRRFGVANPDYEIARALHDTGVRPGDRIGMIGWAFDAYWARLARVRFVAEVPQPEVADFWSETPATRQSVYDAFRRAGARCVVTESVPRTPAADGWKAIGATGFFVRFVDASAAQ